MPILLPPATAWPGGRALTVEEAQRQCLRPVRIRLLADDGGTDLRSAYLAVLANTPLQITLQAATASDVPDAIVGWGQDLTGLVPEVPALLLGEAARAYLVEAHHCPVEVLTQPLHEVLPHQLTSEADPLLTFQEPTVDIPIVRAWRIDPREIACRSALRLLGSHPRAGAYLVAEPRARRLCLLAQPGWSPLAFARAARQLVGRGAPAVLPGWSWRTHLHVLVAAWLDVWVYQPLSRAAPPAAGPPAVDLPPPLRAAADPSTAQRGAR